MNDLELKLVNLFMEVNDLDEPDPLTLALVREFIEGAQELASGKLYRVEVERLAFAIVADVCRFVEALNAENYTTR